MEAFGAYREAELKKFLELPQGIPDERTFIRVFTWIKPEQLSRNLYEWLVEAREWSGTAVNMDGGRRNHLGTGDSG
jgi:hypothetical protein